MKNLLLLIGFFTIVSISAQNNEPKTEIRVNKEVDENGNIVRNDSTYVMTWSSNGDTKAFFNDSLFFGNRGSISSNFFNGFLNDTILNNFNNFGAESFINDFLNNNSMGSDLLKRQQELIEHFIKDMEIEKQIPKKQETAKIPPGTTIHSL
ncbi:MAG: hypothetical protein JXR58_07320 [Bacteroidales bacterium]|nr:hypothetical protein [Bacteroidales bacterium]